MEDKYGVRNANRRNRNEGKNYKKWEKMQINCL